jgi:hypothetical protein
MHLEIKQFFQTNTTYLTNVNTNYSVGANQYRNNSLLGTRGALTQGGGVLTLPSSSFRSAKITFNEFVIYGFNQDVNRLPITNNINAYYGIY